MSNDDYIGVSSCLRNFTNSLAWSKRFREMGMKGEAARSLNDAALWRKEVALWKSYSGAV
jgi:hypothetical protein